MGVRLVFDDHMVVHDVPTFSDALPCASCIGGGEALQSLTGLRIASGWGREVRTRVGGVRACAHMSALLIALATTVLQALVPLRRVQPDRANVHGWPVKIASCFGYRADCGRVKSRWPEFDAAPMGQDGRWGGMIGAGISVTRRDTRKFRLETVASLLECSSQAKARDFPLAGRRPHLAGSGMAAYPSAQQDTGPRSWLVTTVAIDPCRLPYLLVGTSQNRMSGTTEFLPI